MSAFPTNEYQRSTSTPRMMFQRMLSTSGVMLFESPASSRIVVESVWIVNGSTASTTVRLHHLAPRDTASQSNALFYDMAVPAKSTIVVDGTILMSAGDILWASAGVASAITLTGYGRADA